MVAIVLCISFAAVAREHHINGGPVGSESTLRFRVDSLRQSLEPLSAIRANILNDAKEKDATVVIAPIAFALVHCDDVYIPHVLWYLTFSPAETNI